MKRGGALLERLGALPRNAKLARSKTVPLDPAAFIVCRRSVVANRLGHFKVLVRAPPVAANGRERCGRARGEVLTYERHRQLNAFRVGAALRQVIAQRAVERSIDALGKPPEAYEHDMKLWWPHNETAIASLMAYRDTGKPEYLEWFIKTIDYCKEYFSDPEYGEWYGYLRRDGKPTQPPCKGSTFKGPFHLPRMLLMVDEMLGQVLAKD